MKRRGNHFALAAEVAKLAQRFGSTLPPKVCATFTTNILRRSAFLPTQSRHCEWDQGRWFPRQFLERLDNSA